MRPPNPPFYVDLKASLCNTVNVKTDEFLKACLRIDSKTILKQTAPLEHGGPDLNCISNSDTIGVVMLMVILFSLCVQAAEGLRAPLPTLDLKPAAALSERLTSPPH